MADVAQDVAEAAAAAQATAQTAQSAQTAQTAQTVGSPAQPPYNGAGRGASPALELKLSPERSLKLQKRLMGSGEGADSTDGFGAGFIRPADNTSSSLQLEEQSLPAGTSAGTTTTAKRAANGGDTTSPSTDEGSDGAKAKKPPKTARSDTASASAAGEMPNVNPFGSFYLGPGSEAAMAAGSPPSIAASAPVANAATAAAAGGSGLGLRPFTSASMPVGNAAPTLPAAFGEPGSPLGYMSVAERQLSKSEGLGSLSNFSGPGSSAGAAGAAAAAPPAPSGSRRRKASPPTKAAPVPRTASKPAAAAAAAAAAAVNQQIFAANDSSLPSKLASVTRERDILKGDYEAASQAIGQKQSEVDALRKVVADLVMQQARQANREARRKYLANIQRLGWAQTIRTGMSVQEVWMDGAAFQDLAAQERENEMRRRNLEEQKKTLQKARPKKKKDNEDEPGPKGKAGKKDRDKAMEPDEYNEKLEIISLNLNMLKTEEDAIQTQKMALIRERNLHVREMKRINDEDTARYRSLPYRLTDRYVLMCLLGRGGFSEVYKAYDLQRCRLVACKIHRLTATWSDAKKANYIKHATREYEIHKDLKHERIVELYDVFEIDADSFCTVLEYCPGHDLDFLLKQEHVLSERDARNKIAQVISALKYLNTVDPPIIHYDLKPANVLLFDGEVKLTDFGLSKQLKDIDESGNMDLTSQGAGTYWYLPPECFRLDGKARISNKVDVWSVGVIFYQCLFGQKPFGHDQSQQVLLYNNTILNARTVTFPDRPKISDEAKAFIRRCLTYDAAHRPDVAQLCEDPYLKKKATRDV